MKLSLHLFENDELKDIISEKEIEANYAISKILIIFSIVCLIAWELFHLGIWLNYEYLVNSVLLGGAGVSLLSVAVCYIKKGKGRYIKYLLLGSVSIVAFLLNILGSYKLWLIFALPLVMSCRYFNFEFTTIMYFLADILNIITAFAHAYLYKYTSLLDLSVVYYEKETTISLKGYLVDVIANANPDSVMLLKNEFLLTTSINILNLTIIFMACISILKYAQSILTEMNKVNKQKSDMELEVANSRSRIMLSQIQPHFLYNTLSAIMAIDGNPDETVDAIGEFGKYLRENLDVITSGDMVSFQKELQHVMRYVSLEELRFGDKIKVNYDIKTSAFSIPAMTVQMLVENAIKHGISKKPDGGYVNVQTKEIENEFIIVVEDNGLGFDKTKGKPQDGRSHVGLENIEARLKNLCNGTIEIDSAVGVGTIAIVHVPKERV